MVTHFDFLRLLHVFSLGGTTTHFTGVYGTDIFLEGIELVDIIIKTIGNRGKEVGVLIAYA